jgi:mannonate dehydratase
MRIAMVATPFNDHNLKLARQIGVTDIVVRYPGPEIEDLAPLCLQVKNHGMQVSVVEGYLPIDKVVLGQQGREAQLDELIRLVRSMGACHVGVLCYNWMGLTDWTRTSETRPGRGGALCTEFDRKKAEALGPIEGPPVDAAALWENLAWFLQRILPVAEAAGVALAMHPDDPPLSPLRGLERIMVNPEAFERLAQLSSSKANGICFCQGNFAAMGVDVPSTIRRLGPHIRFVHLRDVKGGPDHFVETFHDEGPTDMYEAMRAYHQVGFDGVMRPDHVPVLAGESGEAGYTMQGRLFAVGYMRGLIEAVGKTDDKSGG